MNPVDYSDVQGLARFGYGKLVEASYLLLRIRDAAAARAWLAAAPVSTAEYRQTPPGTALQIAFTSSGLRAMGVPESTLAGFSAEFRTGMAGEDSRSRRLGDIGANQPGAWLWGRPEQAIDLVLMLYAKADLPSFLRDIQTGAWAGAFEIVWTLSTDDMGEREPFGFRDGISQPEFDWERRQAVVSTTVTYANRIALGELLLGYPNEYGYYTDRPLLEAGQDSKDDLFAAEDEPSKKDLGRNGAYLVLRQLEQDVRGLWQYLDRAAGGNAEERYRVAAAMVGRTVDGEPLIPPSQSTAAEQPGQPRNAFTYDSDPQGTRCPFGAHIRRANPRNADLFGHPSGPIATLGSRLAIPLPGLREDVVASTRFHRVLRRGREYGSALPPESALEPAPAGDMPRGLQFACLCANIGRQFEFIQNAWLMSTRFGALTEESDPLLGNRAAVGDCPVTGNFSIPREGKLSQRLTGMPQFVTVRGGAYFFMPSLRGLRFMTRSAIGPGR